MRLKLDSWKSKLGTIAVVVALLIVVHPELRALLLFADVVGLEIIVLLVVTQLRALWPVLRNVREPASALLCAIASAFARSVLRVFPVVLPFRPLAFLFCPALLAVPYGLRCSRDRTASIVFV
jgi:hypothetical protein